MHLLPSETTSDLLEKEEVKEHLSSSSAHVWLVDSLGNGTKYSNLVSNLLFLTSNLVSNLLFLTSNLVSKLLFLTSNLVSNLLFVTSNLVSNLLFLTSNLD